MCCTAARHAIITAMSLLCQSRMYRMSPRYGSTTIARQNIRPARTGLRVESQLVTDAPHPVKSQSHVTLQAVMSTSGYGARRIQTPVSCTAAHRLLAVVWLVRREKAEQPGSAAAPAVADAEDTADESDASSRRLELPRNLKATDLYEEQAAQRCVRLGLLPGHAVLQAAKALKAPLANPLESSPLNFSLPAMPEKLSDIKPPDLSNLAKDLSDLKDKGFSAFDLPEAPPAPSAPSDPAPAPPATTRIELPRYQAAQPTERRQILSTPDPAPPAAPAPPAPAIPYPAQPPAPTPLPTKVVEPASVKNAPQTAVTAKAGKRRGPLPLPVAQLLELGLMAGFVAAITKYNDQVRPHSNQLAPRQPSQARHNEQYTYTGYGNTQMLLFSTALIRHQPCMAGRQHEDLCDLLMHLPPMPTPLPMHLPPAPGGAQTTKVADAVWKVIVAAYTKLESLTAAKTA
ncbi:hypothetical protein QJQ45_029315 [Haematococcus lacustris]|nr:hypothetical protein QJQ45_029315 [Haematococcus lacustris]